MITRPVGSRIIEILELLEEHGDMTYSEIWAHTDMKAAQYVSINARRAVKLGLLTASHHRPAKFSPVADWRNSPLMPKARSQFATQQSTYVTPKASFIFHIGV